MGTVRPYYRINSGAQMQNEEPLRERIDGLLTEPTASTYTNEWYRKQFARIDHLNKILHTEIVEAGHHVRMLRKELHEAQQQRLADAAELGRLQDVIAMITERVTKLESRMDKASEQFAGLKKAAAANGGK